jgi:hypothetical protein
MEKDAARRYPSARAFAEDLQRFLDGDPIEARPVGLATRLVMRARKHKVTVAMAALAVVALITAGIWVGVNRWQAEKRERLVQEFTSQVERIEAEVRYSHLVPVHDIRSDRLQLADAVLEIQQQIDQAGRSVFGAGHYALGRANLALENHEDARKHLELALTEPRPDPRTRRALAMTLTALYLGKLPELEVLGDAELRAQRRSELAAAYQLPALELIREEDAAGSGGDVLLKALGLMHENNIDAALAALEDRGGSTAWQYELDVFEGDLYRQRSLLRQDQKDAEGAKEDLRSAHESYMKAMTTAPSDPAIRRAAAEALLQLIHMSELDDGNMESTYRTALEHLDAVSVIDPEDDRWRVVLARVNLRMGDRFRHKDSDPLGHYEKALAAIEQVREREPYHSIAQKEAGIVHTARSAWFRGLGDTVAETHALRAAMGALEEVAEPVRDYRYFTALGTVCTSLADLRKAAGEPAAALIHQAIEAHREADRRHPGSFIVRFNHGQALRRLAYAEGIEDPVAVLRDAVEAFQAAADLDPEHAVPQYYLGLCHLGIAQQGDVYTGLLGPEAETAIEDHKKALALNPKLAHSYSAIGEIHYLRGLQNWDYGNDPEWSFSEAENAFKAGLEVNPDLVWLHLNQAWLNYYRAKFRIRTGRLPGEYTHQALEGAQRAKDLASPPGADLCIGSVWRLEAEQQLLDGGNPTVAITNAQEAFALILKTDPHFPAVYRALGRLHTLEARWKADSGRNPQRSFDDAGEALRRAIEMKPDSPTICLAEARRCLRFAEWKLNTGEGVTTETSRGVEHCDRALKTRVDWPEARAVRAALGIISARNKSAVEAHDDLLRALADNPHLETEWSEYLKTSSQGPTEFPRTPAVEEPIVPTGCRVMPDHIHLLTMNTTGGNVSNLIRSFKGRTSTRLRALGFTSVWQRGFHDHVLRRHEDISASLRYLLENPVRAHLVEDWQSYPWCGSLKWPEIDHDFFAANPADVLWAEI